MTIVVTRGNKKAPDDEAFKLIMQIKKETIS